MGLAHSRRQKNPRPRATQFLYRTRLVWAAAIASNEVTSVDQLRVGREIPKIPIGHGTREDCAPFPASYEPWTHRESLGQLPLRKAQGAPDCRNVLARETTKLIAGRRISRPLDVI